MEEKDLTNAEVGTCLWQSCHTNENENFQAALTLNFPLMH